MSDQQNRLTNVSIRAIPLSLFLSYFYIFFLLLYNDRSKKMLGDIFLHQIINVLNLFFSFNFFRIVIFILILLVFSQGQVIKRRHRSKTSNRLRLQLRRLNHLKPLRIVQFHKKLAKWRQQLKRMRKIVTSRPSHLSLISTRRKLLK